LPPFVAPGYAILPWPRIRKTTSPNRAWTQSTQIEKFYVIFLNSSMKITGCDLY